ncbi:MAG: Crp/Fnr family transcriptional regulator [Firmicutes bacterium]|nr:Crp/Fnr family transcriptional regulator [Bacillota bacterium]
MEPPSRPPLAGGAGLELASHTECTALTGLAVYLARERAIGRLPRPLRAGEVLYERGDRTDHLYLVQAGTVRESLASPRGRELRLQVAGAGAAVGEMCFCSVRARQETVVAETDAVVVPVYGQDVVRYILEGPDAAREVLEYLFHRIGTLTERIQDLAFASVRERVVRRLAELAEEAAGATEAYDAGAGGEPRILLPPMTHEEWAAHVYATREQVSAILADLRRRGAIDYRGPRSPIAVYPRRLRALAHGGR